jgi:hypothetical protein
MNSYVLCHVLSHLKWFRYVKREHLIDVTEVFRVLNAEKKLRIAKIALYLIVLVVTIFRFVTLRKMLNTVSISFSN